MNTRANTGQYPFAEGSSAAPHRFERSDADLAHAVCHALECDALVPDVEILPTVSHGWVTLEGVVSTRHDQIAVERAVRRVIGVKGATNALRLAGGAANR